MEINHPRSIIKPKMRGHKLRSSGNFQGVLKQTGTKQMGGKQGLDVHSNGSKPLHQCSSIFPGDVKGLYMDTLLHTILTFSRECSPYYNAST